MRMHSSEFIEKQSAIHAYSVVQLSVLLLTKTPIRRASPGASKNCFVLKTPMTKEPY